MEKFNNTKFNSDLLTRPFSTGTDKGSEQMNISTDKTSIASKKPRKPFENKLSFKGEGVMDHEDMSFQESGSFTASHLTGFTVLTNQEKSTIKDLSKQLSSEVLNKAKLCNSQFDNGEVPYWIKLFSDIQSNNDIVIPSHSSYYKATDRNKYIENLIEMCKRDAELYDAGVKHTKLRNENRNNIKSLLITGVDAADAGDVSTHSEISTGTTKAVEINTNDKLLSVLYHYDHREKKDNKLQTRLGSFNDFKAKSMETLIKKKKQKDFNPEGVLSKYAYPKIETINEKEIPFYPTMDDFEFKEDDFSELHYQGGVMEGDGFQELLEIDKKLHRLDPERYSTSINTELKKIKKELAETKDQRMKDIETRYKKKIDMVKSKEPKRTVVFEGCNQNSEKIKHKDYLQDLKRQKQEKEFLDNIDNKIRSLPAEEVKEERRLALIKEVDEMVRSNEDRYRQQMARKIPEEVNCLRMEALMKEIEDMTQSNKERLKEYSEELERDEQITTKEDNKKEEEELAVITNECQRLIEKANQEGGCLVDDMKRVDEVYERICKEEESMKELEEKMRKIAEESDRYDKLYKEYEELIELDEDNPEDGQIEKPSEEPVNVI
jgi:hypothetical protein